MAVNINTAFQGVGIHRARVRGPILAEDLAKVAKDQGLVWELLTNKTAAGGGGAPATNTGHNHTEEGNLLYWPLMQQCFGNASGDAAGVGTFKWPITIEEAGANTTENLLHFPIWIPQGFAGKTFDVILHCNANPKCTVTLEDSSLAAVSTGNTDVPFVEMDANPADANGNAYDYGNTQGMGLWFAQVSPSAAGLHALLIKVELTTAAIGNRYIYGLTVVPRIEPGQKVALGDLARVPTPWPANNATVGDGNDWHELDSAFYADDAALDVIVTLLANNDALIQELYNGLPAAGRTAVTVARGHDHGNDGAGSLGYGKSIEFSVGAWAFGTRAPSADIWGNSTTAPSPLSTGAGFSIFSTASIQNPRHADTSAANSKLYCSYIIERGAGADVLEVRAQVGSLTAVTDTTGPTTAGFHMRTIGPLAYTSATDQVVTISLRDAGTKNARDNALVGFCLYYNV